MQTNAALVNCRVNNQNKASTKACATCPLFYISALEQRVLHTKAYLVHATMLCRGAWVT